jgi:RNA-directed DNA polymerase
MANIPIDKTILHKWLKAGYMEKHVLYPTGEGTPQGGIISPVLANLTLDGLGRRLKEHFQHTTKRERKAAKVSMVRYADDFVRHEARIGHGARAPTASRRAVSLSP